MPDYNGGGFRQGGDGTVFGHSEGESPGSTSDYLIWDWKQIKAAIFGMSSGVASSANLSHAGGVSDPQTLQDAANAFYRVQQTLEAVAKSLAEQARALAGEDGPWRGPAADSFLDMMTNFSRQVQANVDVLSGGSTGRHSVPQQLANNAVNLTNARATIAEIDSWYANQARNMGVRAMSNGLIPISLRPELVAMMTEDMRKVLVSLADHYQVTINAIESPTPVVSPLDGPGGPTADDRTGNQGGGNDLGDLGNLGGGNDLGDLGDLGNLGGGNDLGGGLGEGSGLGDLGGLGGGSGLGDLGSGNLSDLSGFPDTGIGAGLDGAGLDGAGLDAFPGDTDVGAGGLGAGGLGGVGPSLLSPTGFGGRTDTGGLGSLSQGVSTSDPATWGDNIPAAGFPGDTSLGDGLGSGLGNGLGSGLGSGLGNGLGSGLGSGLGDALSTESGLPSGLAGGGMPYLPGMGGMGSPGGAGLTAEPTDASGLLDSSAAPWDGESALGGDDVGSPAGAESGGAGLAGLGMPYLPGMGGMGPASGAGNATDERTEASGLLDPSAEPWAADDAADDEVGSTAGAAPGEAGLGLTGVPYMPGQVGTGAAAGARDAGERTEACALLEPTAEPWSGEAQQSGTDQVSATSAAPDEAVLTGPVIGSDGLPVPMAPVAPHAAVPAPDARRGERSAAAAPPSAGAEEGTGPLPDDHVAVLPVPDADDGEEDISTWETGAGAFVPLLWALPDEHGRRAGETGDDEDEDEQRSTWQPAHSGTGTAGVGSTVVPELLGCGDGEPEELEEPEEGEQEETAEAAEEDPAGRIANLLVQDESAWGTVPSQSGPAY
ncbi:WXG100 family type VII secretion target [Streptomyces coerulescens]|uniref:WXG100 family type VII secretion target n=1 Tax=Streptomyces coerulescens TaxID=29304 RepID=A0ABW0CXX9_STRCD